MPFSRLLNHSINRSIKRFTVATLLTAATALAAHAESFTSSASSAGSASVGSSSDSIKQSSNSSSGDKKVADGDYRIIEVTASADRPGLMQLRLQQTEVAQGAETGSFVLELPKQALGANGMTAGEVVSVRNRDYGVEFARAQTREAFFLVLNDDWRNELDPHAVRAF